MDSRRKKARNKKLRRMWRSMRSSVSMILSIIIVFFLARWALLYTMEHYLEPVDPNDATPIEVTIPKSSSASSIARILYGACGYDQEGLIGNTAVFKIYVDFVGKANSLKAGTYILSKNMTIKQIVDILCEGNPPRATLKFTIPEGYTVRDIASVLLNKSLIQDESELYRLCNRPDLFLSYPFLSELTESRTAGRDYILEGYLFPDTYEVYADSSPEEILGKMLARFQAIYTDAYAARAAEIGYTMDQIITLASLIEREAQVDSDFGKVSAVFHNRLKNGMRLQSCASLSYVLHQRKYTFTAEELSTVSLFNTYLYPGLPCGPICNPGKAAIEAALYPNEEFLSDGYLFFCNGNIKESSELVFAKTESEHQKNVDKYSQYWN